MYPKDNFYNVYRNPNRFAGVSDDTSGGHGGYELLAQQYLRGVI